MDALRNALDKCFDHIEPAVDDGAYHVEGEEGIFDLRVGQVHQNVYSCFPRLWNEIGRHYRPIDAAAKNGRKSRGRVPDLQHRDIPLGIQAAFA